MIVTDRGKPSLVLLSFEEYERLKGPKRSLLDALSMPGLSDVELDIPPRRVSVRDVDLS